MGHALRDYQTSALAELRSGVVAGAKSALLVLPTGGGKTVIAQAIVSGRIDRGGRVLFLAHRAELIAQSARTFRDAGIKSVRTVQANKLVGPEDALVTVASIPTLAGDTWTDRLPVADTVIFDEAHHTRAKSWQKLASAYASALLIGLTATPERADGKALGDIFKKIVVVSTVRELTEQGWLVPCEVFAPTRAQSKLAEDPAAAYAAYGRGKRAIIFCASVADARDVADRLTASGTPAACVDGKISPKVRADLLARFRAGELRVVTNCSVLTEGFDDPGVEVCILARACDHVGMYLQCVGRVLRPAPGKEFARVVDLRGAARRHGLPTDDRTYSLVGKPIRALDDLPPLKQCKRCGYCGRAWRVCPGIILVDGIETTCGATQADPVLAEVRRAAIEQIVARETPDQRRAYFETLWARARAAGRKPGWVAHMFRSKYGEWPRFGKSKVA